MAISKLAKRRVTKLIELMEKLPKSANDHFDMRYVVGHHGKDGPGADHEIDADDVSLTDLHSCGTTACALGWACTMPYFKRIGLSVVVLKCWDGTSNTAVSEPSVFDLDSVTSVDGWVALFGSRNKDKTPKQWAKRARKLLREWERTT